MSLKTDKNWKSRLGAGLIAVAALFVISQIVITAHAAKYGDGPHDHNGQACVLSLAAPGGDKMITAAAFIFTGIVAVWRISNIAAQSDRARIAVRASRPRGPPCQ